MSRNDIRIVGPGAGTVPTWTWQTEANSTAIYAGEPVKLKSAGSPYAIIAADGDFTLGTDTHFLGIAASDSTHTTTADGNIKIYMPLPGLVYEAKAKSSAAADTQSEINLLCGDRVVLDATASVWTVDTAAGDAVANQVLIVGGDPARSVICFVMKWWSNAVDGA